MKKHPAAFKGARVGYKKSMVVSCRCASVPNYISCIHLLLQKAQLKLTAYGSKTGHVPVKMLVPGEE